MDAQRLCEEGERLCGQLCAAVDQAKAAGDKGRGWRLERLWWRAANRTARRMMKRGAAVKAAQEAR